MVESSRIEWVDIAKGVAIIAVVMGHIGFPYPGSVLIPTTRLLYELWHVPVLFMISGFFLDDSVSTSPRRFIMRKVKGLYLPILCFYIPVVLLHNAFIDIGFYDTAVEYGGKWMTYLDVKGMGLRLAASVAFAGREPILAALWFAYVLFMALALLSLISFVVNRTMPDKYREQVRFGLIFSLALIGNVMTNLFGWTIPRFNNTLTACWLIYVGMLAYKTTSGQFNRTPIFLISAAVVYACAVLGGPVSIAANRYDNIVSLTLSSLAALYVVAYLSHRISVSRLLSPLGGILSEVGRDSFSIMALHLMAFKPCTILLNGWGQNLPLGQLTAPAHNAVTYLLYLIAGIILPMAFIRLFRWGKARVMQCLK